MTLDLVIHGQLVTCEDNGDDPLGVIKRGTIGVQNGSIVYVGPHRDFEAQQTFHAEGCVLPGLVDPHTHLAFAGSRVAEMAARQSGIDYRTLSAEGGGIMSTVRATRAATNEALADKAQQRARALRTGGVTTIEAKSGYGLALEHELRLLQAIKTVEDANITRVSPTFLGAHLVPKGVSHDVYIKDVIERQLPAVLEQAIATSCDIYCDDGAFTVNDLERVLSAAGAGGLKLRAHLGQFADLGGVQAAAKLGVLSADHLECVSDAGIAAMAETKMRAVFLPGAWRTLGQKPPAAERFRELGVPIAVGSDLNPGTSPTTDLWMCAALAVRDAGLTLEEAILAVTRESAAAIGLEDSRGTLTLGKLADFAFFPCRDPRALVYALGGVRASHVMIGGKEVWQDQDAASLW